MLSFSSPSFSFSAIFNRSFRSFTSFSWARFSSMLINFSRLKLIFAIFGASPPKMPSNTLSTCIKPSSFIASCSGIFSVLTSPLLALSSLSVALLPSSSVVSLIASSLEFWLIASSLEFWLIVWLLCLSNSA